LTVIFDEHSPGTEQRFGRSTTRLLTLSTGTSGRSLTCRALRPPDYARSGLLARRRTPKPSLDGGCGNCAMTVTYSLISPHCLTTTISHNSSIVAAYSAIVALPERCRGLLSAIVIACSAVDRLASRVTAFTEYLHWQG
jgi:hypothetical protein